MIYILFASGIIFLGWVITGLRKIGSISHGRQIGNRKGSALLLVDLQSVFWDSHTYDDLAKSAAEKIIMAEVSKAKAAGHPVIAIRQEWSIPSTRFIARLTMKGQAIAGSQGTELATPFRKLTDFELTKRVQDAFETGELDTLLKQLDVGRLRLAGLDGSYCIARTAQAARQRGFDTELVGPGILAADPVKYANVMQRLTALGITQV